MGRVVWGEKAAEQIEQRVAVNIAILVCSNNLLWMIPPNKSLAQIFYDSSICTKLMCIFEKVESEATYYKQECGDQSDVLFLR